MTSCDSSNNTKNDLENIYDNCKTQITLFKNNSDSVQTERKNIDAFKNDQRTSKITSTLDDKEKIIRLNSKEKRIILKFSPSKHQDTNPNPLKFNQDLVSKANLFHDNSSNETLRPRWHTQTNIMFMALRSMPNQESSRRELITKALEIDKNFHLNRKLPKAFTGKTPRNSASACLTNNPHKYFEHFYKPGIKQMFFRLTYKPCDLKAAIEEYNKWMKVLIEKDWPKCFGNENDPLDLTYIPKSWQDILEVKDSTIKNAGKGLFAKRKIPKNIPIGFYFGVPTMEDEYDILKDHVGMSAKYSIMYRQTVLDATDKNGMPFTDINGPIYCPFHFANENLQNINLAFLEGYVVNQVICMTTKNIEAGQELFVDYGTEVDKKDWLKTPESNNDQAFISMNSHNNNKNILNTTKNAEENRALRDKLNSIESIMNKEASQNERCPSKYILFI